MIVNGHPIAPESPGLTRGGARDSLGIYANYETAQWVVDTLSDRRFPVRRVSIMGRDLHLVEDVTGRVTVPRAALAGAGSGAWFGLLIGVILMITTPYLVFPLVTTPFWVVPLLIAGLLGAGFGALYGGVAHAATQGRRDFSTSRRLAAARYEVLVDAEVAEHARHLLYERPAAPVPAQAQPSDTPGTPPTPRPGSTSSDLAPGHHPGRGPAR